MINVVYNLFPLLCAFILGIITGSGLFCIFLLDGFNNQIIPYWTAKEKENESDIEWQAGNAESQPIETA